VKRLLLVFYLFVYVPLIGLSKPIDSLIVEYGGGITGQVTKYKFIKNCIYKANYRLIPTGQSTKAELSAGKTKKIYQKANTLLKHTNGFDKPGNVFKSMTLYTKKKKVVYKWGDASFTPPTEVKDLYEDLLNQIKELTFQ
jgi:hypothetical protein